METLIESIKLAISADATDDQRATGALACRTIAAALDTKPGEALAPPVSPTIPQLASAVAVLRGLPPEQLLDLAIARLRAALPVETQPPQVQPLRFQLLPVPANFGTRP